MKRLLKPILLLGVLFGCTPEKKPIDFGHDGCHYCKMTIVDQRYGAEMVTKKGKVYKYDAVECMINSVFEGDLVSLDEIHSIWVIDFGNPKTLTNAEQANYLHSEKLPSPMGEFLTAFSNEQQLEEAHASNGGEIWDWEKTVSFVRGEADH